MESLCACLCVRRWMDYVRNLLANEMRSCTKGMAPGKYFDEVLSQKLQETFELIESTYVYDLPLTCMSTINKLISPNNSLDATQLTTNKPRACSTCLLRLIRSKCVALLEYVPSVGLIFLSARLQRIWKHFFERVLQPFWDQADEVFRQVVWVFRFG